MTISGIAGLALVLCLLPDLSRNTEIGGDLFHYWAAARAFAAGGNPYDLQQVAQAAGELMGAGRSLVPAWGIPSFFTITVPLSHFPFGPLVSIWLAASLIALFCCVSCFGNLFSESRGFRWLTILFLCTFQPALMLVKLAQPALIVFCGAIIYLAAHRSRRPWAAPLAGAGLALTSLKPHLFLGLYLVLLALSLRNRRILMELVSAAVTAAVLAAVPVFMRSDIYALYASASGTNIPPQAWRTPTLGTALQYFTGNHSLLMKLIPTAVVYAAAGLWMWRRNGIAPLSDEAALYGSLILGIAAAPYCWTYDFTLLLPTILWMTDKEHVPEWRSGARWLAIGSLCVANLVLLGASKYMEYDFWYPWLVFLLFCTMPIRPAYLRKLDGVEQVRSFA